MPTHIRRLTPDGLQPVDYTAEDLAAAARFEPDGVYTISNTYDRFHVLKLDAHIDRLEDSARRENIPLSLDRQRLRSALRRAIADSGFDDVRFRITIPRDAPDEAVISLEPFKPPPPEAYTQGVRLVVCYDCKRHNPAAKTTDWMESRRHIQAAFPPGVYEGLLVSERNELLEGLSSNFYAVVDGALRTAGEGVLPGIAQQIVLRIAPAILPVELRPVHVLDIPRLDEAFITSASRGIVPVVQIDDVRIGAGVPGPNTRALRESYRAWLRANLEPL